MAWLFSKALTNHCENLPCLPGQAAESSEADCLAGELYAPSSSTSTPHPCSWRGKTTDALIRFRSGMTFGLSTADRGEAVLTSFLAGFPARTSAPQERAPESMASEAGFGQKWPASLAKYDPGSRSWKTRQCLLLGGLAEFSETWPRWGMTRGGELFPLPTPFGLQEIRAYITSAKELGLSLPTPRSTDGEKGTRSAEGIAKEFARGRNVDLPMAITKIPTPHGLSNNQGQGGGEFDKAVRSMGTPTAPSKARSKKFQRATLTPSEMAQQLATPTATDGRKWNAKTKAQRKSQGSSVRLCNEDRGNGNPIGGQLNPPWVEWLMGWPIGWTDLGPLATDKFQAWLRSHGEFLRKEPTE